MARVNPIPEGYGTITPGITVSDGDKAIAFYKRAFGAEERMRMAGPFGKGIMHAELKIGTSIFMLSDENPAMNAFAPEHYNGSPCGFYLYVEDAEKTQKQAMAAGAREVMPVMDMFWGDKMGCVIDPFGHKWNIATRTRNLTPDEIKTGQETWLKEMAQQQVGRPS
jgi:PhnB protein